MIIRLENEQAHRQAVYLDDILSGSVGVAGALDVTSDRWARLSLVAEGLSSLQVDAFEAGVEERVNLPDLVWSFLQGLDRPPKFLVVQDLWASDADPIVAHHPNVGRVSANGAIYHLVELTNELSDSIDVAIKNTMSFRYIVFGADSERDLLSKESVLIQNLEWVLVSAYDGQGFLGLRKTI